MGEDLDPLSLKELQNLEQQLDTALKHIRARKVCFSYLLSFFFQLYHIATTVSCCGIVMQLYL